MAKFSVFLIIMFLLIIGILAFFNKEQLTSPFGRGPLMKFLLSG